MSPMLVGSHPSISRVSALDAGQSTPTKFASQAPPDSRKEWGRRHAVNTTRSDFRDDVEFAVAECP